MARRGRRPTGQGTFSTLTRGPSRLSPRAPRSSPTQRTPPRLRWTRSTKTAGTGAGGAHNTGAPETGSRRKATCFCGLWTVVCTSTAPPRSSQLESSPKSPPIRAEILELPSRMGVGWLICG
uniref:Uncharacterized protein n=1 Tax=Oryza punctata TaxID=4537 RepID=A0A0E0KU49_ORYPU